MNINTYQKEKPAARLSIAATGIGACMLINHIMLYDVKRLLIIPNGRLRKKHIIPILKIVKIVS